MAALPIRVNALRATSHAPAAGVRAFLRAMFLLRIAEHEDHAIATWLIRKTRAGREICLREFAINRRSIKTGARPRLLRPSSWRYHLPRVYARHIGCCTIVPALRPADQPGRRRVEPPGHGGRRKVLTCPFVVFRSRKKKVTTRRNVASVRMPDAPVDGRTKFPPASPGVPNFGCTYRTPSDLTRPPVAVAHK